jgi:hypothetical protein
MIDSMIWAGIRNLFSIRHHRSVKHPFCGFREYLRKIICPFDMGGVPSTESDLTLDNMIGKMADQILDREKDAHTRPMGS